MTWIHNPLRWLQLAGVCGLTTALIILGQATAAWAQEDGVTVSNHSCGSSALQPEPDEAIASKFGPLPTPAQPVSLTPAEQLEVQIRFLRHRGYRTSEDIRLVYIDTDPPPDPEVFPNGSIVAVNFQVFKRDSDAAEVRPIDHVVYSAVTTPRGVNLRFCFNSSGVDPGRYQTAVQLANPMLQHSPIPFVVTVQENRLWLMVPILLLAMVGGTAVLYFQSRAVATSQGGRIPTPRNWLARNWLGLGAGVVAAWATWNGQYLQNEAFGAEGVQYIQLLAACGAAFAGAGVAGSLTYEKVASTQSKGSTDPVRPATDTAPHPDPPEGDEPT